MAGNSYKSGEVFEGLARVQRGSLVLSRRARVSALFALFFAGFAGLFLLAGGLALWMTDAVWPVSNAGMPKQAL